MSSNNSGVVVRQSIVQTIETVIDRSSEIGEDCLERLVTGPCELQVPRRASCRAKNVRRILCDLIVYSRTLSKL